MSTLHQSVFGMKNFKFGSTTQKEVGLNCMRYLINSIDLFLFEVEFPDNQMRFKMLVQEYLFSPDGRHYLPDIKVDDGNSIFDIESNFTIIVMLNLL